MPMGHIEYDYITTKKEQTNKYNRDYYNQRRDIILKQRRDAYNKKIKDETQPLKK